MEGGNRYEIPCLLCSSGLVSSQCHLTSELTKIEATLKLNGSNLQHDCCRTQQTGHYANHTAMSALNSTRSSPKSLFRALPIVHKEQSTNELNSETSLPKDTAWQTSASWLSFCCFLSSKLKTLLLSLISKCTKLYKIRRIETILFSTTAWRYLYFPVLVKNTTSARADLS